MKEFVWREILLSISVKKLEKFIEKMKKIDGEEEFIKVQDLLDFINERECKALNDIYEQPGM